MDLFSIPGHLAEFKKLLGDMNEKLDRIKTVVEHTHSVVSEMEQKMEKTCDKMEKLSEKTHSTGKQFEACAQAFWQV